jgi:hypothetical protein
MGVIPVGLAKYLAGKKKAGQLGTKHTAFKPTPPPFGQPSSMMYGGVNGPSLAVTEPTGKKVNLKKALKKHGPKKGSTC